jgi:hypothetical protein
MKSILIAGIFLAPTMAVAQSTAAPQPRQAEPASRTASSVNASSEITVLNNQDVKLQGTAFALPRCSATVTDRCIQPAQATRAPQRR